MNFQNDIKTDNLFKNRKKGERQKQKAAISEKKVTAITNSMNIYCLISKLYMQ